MYLTLLKQDDTKPYYDIPSNNYDPYNDIPSNNYDPYNDIPSNNYDPYNDIPSNNYDPYINKAVRNIENEVTTNSYKPTESIKDNDQLEVVFNRKFTNIYYRNMMDSCNRKLFKHKIIDNIKLLLNSVINESNKNVSNKFILSTIEKFIRYKENNLIKYDIYAFMLNLKKDISRKYKFEIIIDKNKVVIKNIQAYNVDKPIKRFTCSDSIDCSERQSSFKKKFKSNFIPNIDSTEFEYDIFKNPLDNSKNSVLNRTNPILDPNMKINTTFPCRKNKFSWDIHGIEYVEPVENDCYGINSATQQKSITPYYHKSLFNKFNFENKTDINNVFNRKNLLYRDKTLG